MSPLNYQTPDLRQKRDNALVKHVFRNSITLPSVVHRLYFEPDDVDTDACRKVLARLIADEYLTEYPLWRNQRYIRLGPQSVKRWGFPRNRTRMLGAQRLPYEYGALCYTCCSGHPRTRLLRHELKRRFPWFLDDLINKWAYVLDGNRLGMIRVEVSGNAQRIITKLGTYQYQYAAQPEFSQLIDSGRFFFVIITATELQAKALNATSTESPVDFVTHVAKTLVRFM